MKTKRILLAVASLGCLVGCHEDDTMEDIWPDPSDRTAVLIRGVQEAIASYWSEHQTLPLDLNRLAADRARYLVATTDAWGTPLRYLPLERGYCIWSAGPDSQFGSSDDSGVLGDARDVALGPLELTGPQLSSRCEVASR